MKREISKKIKSISDSIGSSAAAAESERIITVLEREYDAKIRAGMSELDAYRSVLQNVGEIEALLKSMPKTEDEISREMRLRSEKSFWKALRTISSIIWILAVIAFFALRGLTDGLPTWLVFIYAAVLQNVVSMVKRYNSGKSLKKTLRGGLSAILWLLCVIVFFLIRRFVGSAWLIFLIGVIAQMIINAMTKE